MELRSSKRNRTDTEADRWTTILGEILGLIAGKIVSVADFVRFVAVCRTWRSLSADFSRPRFGPMYIPGGADPNSRRVTVLDPGSDAALALDLPETAGSRCWGSPFGWLVTYEHPDRRFNLVNPFSGATINLPPLTTSRAGGRWWDRLRAFLTADPDSDPDDCHVIVSAYFRKLAFVRPGKPGRGWSGIDVDFHLIDIARCNGNIYGLGFSPCSRVQVFQFEPNHRRKQNGPRFVQILELNLNPPEENRYPIRVEHGNFVDHIRSDRHLVDLNGELCLCVRSFDSFTTIDFKLYRIDPSGLTRVLSLGDRCLFLGNTCSFSCKASYPRGSSFFEQCGSETGEFVSNYVFYAHNREWDGPWGRPYGELSFDKRPFDIEVWDMSSSTKVYGRKDSPTSSLYGPLWILPSIKYSLI